MKKFAALLLALVMVFSLAACSSSDSSSDSSSSDTSSESSVAETTTTTETSSSSSETTSSPSSDTVTENLNENVSSGGAVDVFDFMDESAVDTTRKSTLNSDERYPEVTFYTNAEITSWSPWQTPQGRSSLIATVYEPLFYYHDGYVLEACLAKDWYDEDDTHMIVEIYDYIHDSVGNPITASDVVYSFNTFVESGNANDFAYFGSVEVVDEYTVRFTWSEPINSITSLATMMETLIYSEESCNTYDFTTNPVGTGAYALTELVTGAKYTLEPVDYWQTDESVRCSESTQNVDKMVCEVINDTSVAYVAFQEGSLFSVSPTATQLMDFLEGGDLNGKYTLTYEHQSGRTGLAFNMSGESIISDDLNLRLAIAYAIDSEGIVDALGSDSYYMMHAEAGSTVSGYQDVWDTMENYYTVYDTDLAKEYLEKSNYNGETIVILNQSGDDSKNTCVQIIQQELEQVGINARIDSYERAIINTYLYDVTCWDLFLFNWNGDPISQQWGRQLDVTNYGHGYNEAGSNDPVLQEMIERVQTIDGYTDELILEIQEYLCDNCHLYAIYGTISWNAYDPAIANLTTAHGHSYIFYNACNYYLD